VRETERRARLARRLPALMLVTDGARLRERALADVVRDAVSGGVNMVQLREKHLERPALLRTGAEVREAVTGRALFFVNGDIEVARALRAEGLHLPSYGATIRDARRRLGDEIIISLAVHSVEAAVRGEAEGADLLVLGTVFDTTSHPGVATIGLAGLRETANAVGIPVIGIGGVTTDNAADVIRAGAAGVAVISAIFDAPDARRAASLLRAAIATEARA
jgi:thiamine-phosphate pyrophosphorylase